MIQGWRSGTVEGRSMATFDDKLARLLMQEHAAGTKFHP